MKTRMFARLALAAAVLAAAGHARAADTYIPVTPPAPVAYDFSTPDFSGPYVGVTAGGRWSNFDTVFGTAGAGSEETGFTGGVIGGIAFQSDRLVYGIEGDVNFATGDSTSVVAGVPVTSDNDWFSTLRGRVGYAFDSAMVYGTGGLAVGDVEVSTPAGSDSSTEFGWTLGAGVEMPLTDNFTARAEYLYTDLGSKSGEIGGTPFKSEFDSHTVRAGVTYTFR
ncbi:outer membrane protein [Lutibaculum baratangense]|uniref:31 kDa outer-membrane immunogenic protein n=1 Tax=Lutibaculum baratangense AMV1 TaxID=631454 RepID=V4RCS5_9HYPH|nr:outer membrane protein [Lutibaculum baratangense]ESR23199.1 31 kDa outer-membrane immunogenic protein [Lutibaculum baratangense AMV1]